jgi:hypothetical protein
MYCLFRILLLFDREYIPGLNMLIVNWHRMYSWLRFLLIFDREYSSGINGLNIGLVNWHFITLNLLFWFFYERLKILI